ncbi:MAG TPA: thiamine phosphate synthase [Candidatus Dormibacteraeota bacterium]|nr:thiamine phosphate synthase [Candidatus Dormibacteraeota bacterium]
MRLRQGARGLSREAPPDPHIARARLAARLGGARLYFITPDAPPARVLELAEAAFAGGADVVQLRHKTLSRGELLALARRVRQVAVKGERLFVVNDHLDIALLSEADGVHLGPDDITIESARRVAGDRLLVGASASTPQDATAAVNAGADYLGTGPAFETPIKTQKRVIGPGGVAAVVAAAGPAIPVFAIGGIDESNVGALIAKGVRRVCVIRAIGDAADPESAARRLRAMLDA